MFYKRHRTEIDVSPRIQRDNSENKPKNTARISPMNSPLDGFKCSVADSTISDDLLAQFNTESAADSPIISPRRISLDDRINQVLGLEKEPAKSVDAYPESYYKGGYCEQGFSQVYQQKNVQYTQSYTKDVASTKVVQVGNMIQIVPTEELNAVAVEVS